MRLFLLCKTLRFHCGQQESASIWYTTKLGLSLFCRWSLSDLHNASCNVFQVPRVSPGVGCIYTRKCNHWSMFYICLSLSPPLSPSLPLSPLSPLSPSFALLLSHPLSQQFSDNDELNKTLPPNFHLFPQSPLHSRSSSGLMLSPSRGSPVRSLGVTTRGNKETSIRRRQPVAPHQKPNLLRYKKESRQMGKSDPDLVSRERGEGKR